MFDTDFPQVLIIFYVREREGEGGLSSIVNSGVYPLSSLWLWGRTVTSHKHKSNSGVINILFPQNELRKCPFFSIQMRKVLFHIVPFHGIIKLIISFIFKTTQTSILKGPIGDSSMDLISGYFTLTPRIAFRLMIYWHGRILPNYTKQMPNRDCELWSFKFPLKKSPSGLECLSLKTFNNAGVNHFNTLNWRSTPLRWGWKCHAATRNFPLVVKSC